MKILKKILAIAIIIWMFGQVSVNSVVWYYQDNEYKEKILTYKHWEKYIKLIDNFVLKVSDKKVKNLKIKIYKILNGKKRLSDKNTAILKYIIQKLEEREYLLAQQAKKDVFKNTLSESDTKKVNDELVKIQKNLLKQGVNSFEKILWELETYTNFEEKGDFEAKFNMDMEEFWKSKINLKLKDYISKNSGFDAQFKTKIEWIIEATPKGEEEVKMEINAFIDYIIKDQNYYVLLKNLKIVDEKDLLKMDSKIQKIKEITEQNKYITFWDKNTAQIVSQLKELNPANILKEWNSIVWKSLFTAYKKEWNKFYLIPSKYACDTAKTLSKRFDPFNGNTCTEWQYKDLLDNIANYNTEFYIDFSWKNTVIGFDVNKIDDDIEEFKWNITFSDKYIEEINFIAVPDQKRYLWEWASLNFVRWKKLDAKLYADSENIDLKLVSTLDWANRFKSIDFSFKSDENFASELTLKNRKIAGSYSWKWYNNKYAWVVTWRTNTNNKLDTLNISNKYINSSSYNPGETNTTLEYSYGKYSIDNKYVSEWFISDLNTSFNIASNNKLTELNFDLLMSKKEYNYDENYNKTYTWSFIKILDSKIELKNKNISWKTIIFDENKEYLKITNIWRYEEDKFELNTKIDFTDDSKKFLKYYLNDVIWKVEANFNIKTDISSNKNNFNIYADVKLDDKKAIYIELDNKSRKTYKDVKILAPLPNDTIPLEEVLENPELY